MLHVCRGYAEYKYSQFMHLRVKECKCKFVIYVVSVLEKHF